MADTAASLTGSIFNIRAFQASFMSNSLFTDSSILQSHECTMSTISAFKIFAEGTKPYLAQHCTEQNKGCTATQLLRERVSYMMCYKYALLHSSIYKKQTAYLASLFSLASRSSSSSAHLLKGPMLCSTTIAPFRALATSCSSVFAFFPLGIHFGLYHASLASCTARYWHLKRQDKQATHNRVSDKLHAKLLEKCVAP
jgi:hypothetical protein